MVELRNSRVSPCSRVDELVAAVVVVVDVESPAPEPRAHVCLCHPLPESTVCRVRVVEAYVIVDVECQPPRVHSALLGSGLCVPIPPTLIAAVVVDDVEGVEVCPQ